VLVPAAAVGLLLTLHAHPRVTAGFLIAAVWPGALCGPPFTAMAKGDVAAAVGLLVILVGSSVLMVLLLLHVLPTYNVNGQTAQDQCRPSGRQPCC
jgi:predicted Na+-dependent transporter